MQKLSDILKNGSADSLRKQWDETPAAAEFEPLPAGEYVARVVAGELTTCGANETPGYKFRFKVLEGEHKGRQFFHVIWLTSRALPMAKRDLAKIGVTELEQLDQPLPPGIRCRVKLSLRRGDNGNEFNEVRGFVVEGVDTLEPDVFAPTIAETNGIGPNDKF